MLKLYKLAGSQPATLFKYEPSKDVPSSQPLTLLSAYFQNTIVRTTASGAAFEIKWQVLHMKMILQKNIVQLHHDICRTLYPLKPLQMLPP